MLKRLIATAALVFAASPAWSAACSVSEFRELVTLSSGQVVPIARSSSPGPTTQIVAATAPAELTNVFASGTRWLWIYCDEMVHYQTGTAPETGLDDEDMRIPAGGFWLGLTESEVLLGTLKIAFCDADCA